MVHPPGMRHEGAAGSERVVRRKIACPGRTPIEHPRVKESGSPPGAPARLWSLDVLRGICAGVVFLSHWHLWSGFAPRSFLEEWFGRVAGFVYQLVSTLTWPTGGHHPAVLGFFVLSGFCIHYPFARRALAGEPSPDWRAYLRRRFFRIVPVYWAACLLGLVFVAAQVLHPAPSALLKLHAGGSLEDFVVRFSGLAGVYPREIFAGNYILTTVTVEIIMYAAYPLFSRPMLAGRGRTVGAVFVGLHAFAILLLVWFSPYWVFNSVFMLGVFWYGGALAAQWYLTRRIQVATHWLVVAWVAFLAVKFTPHFPGLNLIKQAAWAVVCTLGILWCLRWEANRAVASHRFILALRRVGDLSYSLYAMHTPAIMLATWVLLHSGVTVYTLQLVATMAFSLAATLGVHHWVERPWYARRDSPAPRA